MMHPPLTIIFNMSSSRKKPRVKHLMEKDLSEIDELYTIEELDILREKIVATKKAKQKQEVHEKKIKRMAKSIPRLLDLMSNCAICTTPLLTDIGTTSFGVVSYACKCSIIRKIHFRCCVSTENVFPKCAFCRSDMVFIAPSLVNSSPATKRIKVSTKESWLLDNPPGASSFSHCTDDDVSEIDDAEFDELMSMSVSGGQ